MKETIKYNLFSEDFFIYGLKQHANIYAAIPSAFVRLIRQYVMEYQSLHAIPEDKQVKCILFDQNAEKMLDKYIPINQLSFEAFN